MFSMHCNSCVKSLRNKERSTKKTKIKPFINNYNQEGIKFSSEKDDWKMLEKINVAMAHTVLYGKKRKIYPATFF